jgi:hypothetical protein
VADFLRCELGSTLILESGGNSDYSEVRLEQFELPVFGRKYECAISRKPCRRFDLPALSQDDTELRIVPTRKLSVEGMDSKKILLPGIGDRNEFYDWFQLFLEIRERARPIANKGNPRLDAVGLPSLQMPWLAVFAAVREIRQKQDAPLEPIVEIARNAWPVLDLLYRNPRKVLRRERKLVQLGKLNEVDDRCIRWMVRQSGRTLAERAGSRQQLMGVVRKDNYDTLENRVLKDLGVRAARQTRTYLNRYGDFRNTKRYGMVAQFGKLVENVMFRSAANQAASLKVVPKPNFVLQYDSSYRRAWNWYLDLVRYEEDLELAGKWRLRLWRDWVFLLLNDLLTGSNDFEISPKSFTRFRQWQNRGSWILNRQSPIFWDERSNRIAQIVPADYPLQYDRFLKGRFGGIFGTLGASYAALVWKDGRFEPESVSFFVTEPRPFSVWTGFKELHDELESRVKELGENLDFKVSVLCPEADGSLNVEQQKGGLVPIIGIPACNETMPDDERLKLRSLVFPAFS